MSNNPSDQPSPGPGQVGGSATGPDPSQGTGFATPPRPATGGLGGSFDAPPPGTPPPPVARQLVRDPYSKLGGVASGISHHYGVDVSLVRLAFVLFTIFTGFGIVFYALAWLIIPRAQFWPPIGGRRPTRPLTSREIGIGLLLIAAMVALFVNGGTFSQVLTPLVLIAGGVWLLTQSPNPTPVSTDAANAAPGSVPFATDPMGSAYGQDPVAQPTVGETPPGTPVTPRSGRRKAAVIGFLGVIALIPLLIIGGIIAAVTFGEFESDGFSATYQPATVAAIPEVIEHGQGDIVIDLTELDGQTFDEPVDVDVNLDLGAVKVIVPESIEVSVEADAGLGDVSVFDRTVDGVNPATSFLVDEADVVLDIHVGVGEIKVERADG